MSPYRRAVLARQQVQAFVDGNDDVRQVVVVPGPGPNTFVVQVITDAPVPGLPTEVDGVAVVEVVGVPTVPVPILHEAALASYQPLTNTDGGFKLLMGKTHIATTTVDRTFRLARAFVTAGETRIANAGTATVTIDPFAGDTIGGAADLVLAPGESATLFSDGNTNWVRF